MDRSCVIVEKDVENSIYEIPLILSKAGLDQIILDRFQIERAASLDDWEALLRVIRDPEGEVHIGMVGKYSELQDAYKSVDEALMHGGYALGKKVIVEKIAAEDIEKDPTILKKWMES